MGFVCLDAVSNRPTDNFTTLEQIAELFKDWKGIDFNSVIEKQKAVTFS
ncbi:hypothetical protein [Dolichospermum flos-aquae]|uniref:Uncharacterized protein n=1 Tax=Dolichospermum flos-aquae LEGE 04289 TaxID=1828708 RepID=A0ACC5PXL2_DOLFA|nr:hypothetical protein [Dolichospermum flos-aquae]MBE9217921.1 hypothetical protein [Dolichospermum flos-aquae LEGE 04289]